MHLLTSSASRTRPVHKLDLLELEMVLDVLAPARAQVIEHDDLISARDKCVD
jgi:hypothetical protein